MLDESIDLQPGKPKVFDATLAVKEEIAQVKCVLLEPDETIGATVTAQICWPEI